ncbi:MAG: IS200/IS605 family transposase [candidate division Zixibacteria bacterium]|nr:IS200/IS605 family transposase [candidate division Zixibacteria bacterium]
MGTKTKASSAVYCIKYHFVWCTKYRRKILNGSIGESTKRILQTICDAREWEIVEIYVMEDHVHLFVSTPPFESPTSIVKILKGVSAKQLFAQHPEIRNVLWRGTLWSPSYYVGTAGDVSSEIIIRYIQNQQTHDGRRNSSPG